MVFHLPNEDTFREIHNYNQPFALNIGLIGMVVTFFFLSFLISKKYMLQVARNEQLGEHPHCQVAILQELYASLRFFFELPSYNNISKIPKIDIQVCKFFLADLRI
jgi:hypothetical protein